MSLTITKHFELVDYECRAQASISIRGSNKNRPYLRNGVAMVATYANEETKRRMYARLDKWFQRYIGAA